VYFPGGKYLLATKATSSAFQQIDVAGMHGITFLGAPGRSRLLLQGDAKGDDWYLFAVRNNSYNIEFRHLALEMGTITNPDPVQQNHIVQLGTGNLTNTGCHDVRFIDCEFRGSVGDAVRLLGAAGSTVDDIAVNNCRFYDCGRTGVSFQRWVRRVMIRDCYFEGGHDQQIDFEPTGYVRTATSGGGANTLVDSAASFTTWGISAGDPIYNVTDDVLCTVVSVDSATQLTVGGGAATWNLAQYYFPTHNYGHLIIGNQLRVGSFDRHLLMTLSGCYKTAIIGNHIEGGIQGQDVIDCVLAENEIMTRPNGQAGPAITMIKAVRGTQIIGNNIVCRQNALATARDGIAVYEQGRRPHSFVVTNNTIRLETRGVGIYLTCPLQGVVQNNRIALYTPGDSGQSVGIYCRATVDVINSYICTGNEIFALAGSGTFQNGIVIAADVNVNQCLVGGGTIADCTNAYLFSELGGVFVNPPVIIPGIIEDGTNPIVPPTSKPWVLIAGAGGAAAPGTSYKPAIFWGTGSPEGALTAGIGCLAMRRDGSGGTCVYVKVSGTGNTGWVPMGGVASTGSITCIATASIVDGETVTIGDGLSAPKVYEFDVNGTGVTGGRIQVNVSTDTTATQVAARLVSAIQANQPALIVSNSNGVISVTHQLAGAIGNVTITEAVANASFVVSGMASGVNAAR
jgi:hypothetical protein